MIILITIWAVIAFFNFIFAIWIHLNYENMSLKPGFIKKAYGNRDDTVPVTIFFYSLCWPVVIIVATIIMTVKWIWNRIVTPIMNRIFKQQIVDRQVDQL